MFLGDCANIKIKKIKKKDDDAKHIKCLYRRGKINF